MSFSWVFLRFCDTGYGRHPLMQALVSKLNQLQISGLDKGYVKQLTEVASVIIICQMHFVHYAIEV